jgi:hypothetical protein
MNSSQTSNSSSHMDLKNKSISQKRYLTDFFLGNKCLKRDNGHKYSYTKLKDLDAILDIASIQKYHYRFGALNLPILIDVEELIDVIDARITEKKQELLPIALAASSISITGDMLVGDFIKVLEAKTVLLILLATTVLPQEILDQIKTRMFYQISMVSLGLYILETISIGENNETDVYESEY